MFRSLLHALAFTLLAAFAVGEGTAAAQQLGYQKAHWWFTLDVDFAGGGTFRPKSGLYEQRLRIGPNYVAHYRFWSLGATAETFNFSRFAFGLQADLVDIDSGWGAYAGPTVSTGGKFGVTVGLGWSIFHVESQVLFEDRTNVALFGLLRLPIGHILYAKYGPKLPLIIPPGSIVFPAKSVPPPISPQK